MEGVKMKYLLLHGYAEHGNNNTILHNICRGEDNKQYDIIITDLYPYFYADITTISDELDNARRITETEIPSFDGKKLWKIEMNFTNEIEPTRKLFDMHYEADILFPLRFRYDTGIKSYFECDHNNHSYRRIKPIDEELNIKPKTFCIDIENMDNTWSDAEDAENPIVSFAVKSETTGKYIVFINTKKSINKQRIHELFKEQFNDDIIFTLYTYDTERDMLISYVKMLDETSPDILYGWNFVDYDQKYIENRCRKLNVKYDDRNHQTFDAMKGYSKLSENDLPSTSLDEIAATELGQRKMGRTHIYEMIENDVERLIAYNLGDVYLTSKINEKRNVLGFHLMLAKVSGTELNRTPMNSYIADSFFMHIAHNRLILPSCHTRKVPAIDKGAIVQEPSTGILKWVASFDLSKAYPTAMIENNLSPDTLIVGDPEGIPHIKMPSGRCYRTDIDGIVKLAAVTLTRERERHQLLENECLKVNDIENYKNHKETEIAIKKVTNSLYGSIGQVDKVRGTNTFRLAHGDVASDVTRTIREVITWIISKMMDIESLRKYTMNDEERNMLDVIVKYQNVIKKVGGDTDSSLFYVPYEELLQETNDKEHVIKLLKLLEHLLTRSTKEFSNITYGNNGIYNIEFEKLYNTFFQAGTKKRYVGVYEWRKGNWMENKPVQERIEVRGYEVRRSDWSPMCKEFMQSMLKMLFIDCADKEEIGRVIRTWKKSFYNGDFNQIMKWPKRASSWVLPGETDKNGNKKSVTAQQRAIEISNTYLGRNFHKGDKPWMCYVRRIIGGPIVDIVALDVDDDPEKYAEIDYDIMWEKQARDPLSRIIEGIGWNYNDLESGVTTNDPEDFF